MRRSWGMLGILPAILALLGGGPARAEGWQAGTARAVITPERPIWMAGYAARNHPSEGKLHDLWAKALALRDEDGRTAVLVTLDVCGIDRELSNAIRDRIREKHGLGREAIVLACSHTHSGPVLGANLRGMYPLDEEQRRTIAENTARFADRVIGVVGEALAAMSPAEVSRGTGRCGFAVNRRNNDQAKAAELRSALALQGPVDHDVPVLKVAADDGAIRAVVFLYACHCTVLQGYQLSGDFAGDAQIAVERAHPGAQAMFVAGCGADQNPLPRGTVELAGRYGAELSASVERVLAGPLSPVAPRLAADYREIDLELAAIPDRKHWEEEAQSSNLAFANRARRMLERLDAEGSIPTKYPYPVQAWRLGDDLRWIFLGGEVTVEYALHLKRNLDPSSTWVGAYCNDVMAYIPSLRVLQEGGYEGGGAMVYYGLPAPWSERVEEQVIDAVRAGVEATRP